MSSADSGKTTSPAAANKSGSSLFFQGVKREFGKIIWPGKESLIKSTSAVVAVSVVVGLIIAVIDRVVLYGLNLIIK